MARLSDAELGQKADKILEGFKPLYPKEHWPHIIEGTNVMMAMFATVWSKVATKETAEPIMRIVGKTLSEAAKYRRQADKSEQSDRHIWGLEE